MAKTPPRAPAPELILAARTAADLMMPNPISLRDTATVHEALVALTDRGYSAAPVIDEAGHPVGVLSQTDLLIHARIQWEKIQAAHGHGPATAGTGGCEEDKALVRDLMTPGVFSAAPDASAQSVVEQLLALKVHHLYVMDGGGVVVGVISAVDVLRHLRPAADITEPLA
jgi:CBS domain-containing protein